MDEISKEFLTEVDKLSLKYHRQIKIIVKFDEVKGVYPAYRIVEFMPEKEKNSPDQPVSEAITPVVNEVPVISEEPTQGVNPKEFENHETPAKTPQGQVEQIAKENVEA